MLPYTRAISRRASAQAPDSEMCKQCGELPRSQMRQSDGRVISYPYCGQNNCTKSPPRSLFPISSIPTPAAIGNSDSISIRPEDLRDPVAKTVATSLQSRWVSNGTQLRDIKTIYRIDLSAKIYRRFDTALQMNDGCTVITTYYGGRETCGISNESAAKANPCILESCATCTVIRSAFGNFLYGNSSHHGTYGPGLYTYTNPALAHQAIGAPTSRSQAGNYAIIQCRVVSQGGGKSTENSYAGFVDETGLVFCAQPVAIIPTHLVVYSAVDKSDPGSESVASTSQALFEGLRNSSSSYTDGEEDYDLLGSARPARWLQWGTVEGDSEDDLPVYLPLDSGTEKILFYGKTQQYSEFTNYAPYPVTYKGKTYPTAEHLFQARKFLGHRPLIAEHIRRGGENPQFAFKTSRKWAPEVRPDWKEKSIEIMQEILELKFRQHPKLQRLLLATGNKYLILNAGKDDDFWGNGADGSGRNELGVTLMQLRDKLKAEQ